jgi:probable rRNA maturation factor
MSPGSRSVTGRLAAASGYVRRRAPSILYLTGSAPFRMKSADKRSIEGFVRLLNLRLAGGRGFDCLLTSDEELRRLNRDFLQRDYSTDVLSFPSGSKSGWLGDLAISVERAKVQAHEFGHSLLDEIRILLLHGVLHLMGFDHEHDDGRMLRVEQKWRAEFDLPETLISRSLPPRSSRGRAPKAMQ